MPRAEPPTTTAGRATTNRGGPPGRRLRAAALGAGAVVGALAVGAAVLAVTGGSSAHDPSGETMPTSDGGAWHRVYSEDFADDAPTGTFASRYADRFTTYDGFADTAGTGRYSASAVTAHEGLLDVGLRTTDGGTPLAGGVVPLVDGRWGGQTSGRYSIRMKSDRVDGYGVAVLLWSDANRWSDGEVDFPEGGLGQRAWLNVHCLDDPARQCVHHETDARLTDWHTYTIEWTPERMTFLVDGRTVGTTTEDVPTARMHLVLQAGSTGGTPPRASRGSVLVDWVTIDVPTAG